MMSCVRMILNFSYHSLLLTLHAISHLEHTISNVYNWVSSNFLSLNPSKIEFLLVGLPQQLSELSNPITLLPNNVTLSPVCSARNLGVIFDSNLTFSQHISAVSKSCFYQISWPHTHSKYHWSYYSLYYCYISHSFQTWLLQFSSIESAFYSN